MVLMLLLRDYSKIILMICLISLLSCSSKKEGKVTEGPSHEAIKKETKTESDTVKYFEESAKNKPPRIVSVLVNPKFPVLGDTISVEVNSEDPDGDIVSLEYKWFKNGQELKEATDKLKLTEDFKRGDKIVLKIIPYDGKEKGNPGEAIIVVGNSPPIINTSSAPLKIENRRFTYQIKAEDPDGDPLIYSLKSAPSGMTINNTGLIEWKVPDEFKGKVPVTVSVIDGHGGEVLYNFEVSINL